MSQETVTTSTAPIPVRVKPSFFRAAVLKAFGAMTPRPPPLSSCPTAPSTTSAPTQTPSPCSLPLAIPAAAAIRIRRENFFTKCALAGDIGFAESYIDGDWETPNLTAVIAFFILNADTAPTLSGSKQAKLFARLPRGLNRIGHLLRPNSRATAQRNISEHYDLANDFFALFLDPSMMYSAAKWTSPGFTLEEAQREKNDALCRHLRLKPTDHVLEVGTGWGGWSLHAARTYGCRVTTVTISREQLEYARARIAAAGLADRVTVEFRDYRDLSGQFDKIVSIEMMEAIGHRYLPEFTDVLNRCLKPDGLLALQFITCPTTATTSSAAASISSKAHLPGLAPALA